MGSKSSKKLDTLAEQLRAKGAPVMETGHEVWLAGLGALSVARKKGEKVAGKGSKMFDSLVAEGKKLEKKVGKSVRSDAHELAERISGAAGKAVGQAKKVADQASDQAKKASNKARDRVKKTVVKASNQVKKTVLKAKNQAKKTVLKAKNQAKKTVAKASGQVKKTALKPRGQAKKAPSKVIPQRTGPAMLHLLPRDDQWTVHLEGSEGDLSRHSTKHAAVKAARLIARTHAPSKLVVHRTDGTVQESFSYD